MTSQRICASKKCELVLDITFVDTDPNRKRSRDDLGSHLNTSKNDSDNNNSQREQQRVRTGRQRQREAMKWTIVSTSMLATTVGGTATTMEMEKAVSHEMEIPDPFSLDSYESCADNAVVAGWCDSHLTDTPDALQCGMLTPFHEYACACPDHPKQCPTECLEGSELIAKTRTGIRCRGFPVDSPNYILKEMHKHRRNDCGDNALVAAWCDEFVNFHVECSLYPALDQYVCRCHGKATNCPDECLDGGDALIRTPNGVVCTGIPVDTLNYQVN